MHFSLSTSPKHKKEYSSDSSEKKYNLLHFRRISMLIELILAGKAKLSMASCYDNVYQYDKVGQTGIVAIRRRLAKVIPESRFETPVV